MQTNSVIHSSSVSSLSSLRLTVHPQFFRPVTFESQRLTIESLLVCVVFEAVVYRRANMDEEFAQRAAALERSFFSLKVSREASSLKLLREKVGLRPWTRSQGRPLPWISSGRKSTRKRVRRTLGVATPHKGEHTKGETGSESWWTLLWCLWRPPSLSCFLWGFPFLGTEGAT